jgi:hypothetical protein
MLSETSGEDNGDVTHVQSPPKRSRLAAVVVPPVRNRHEYVYYEPKDEVESVVREFSKRGDMRYEVTLFGGKTKEVRERPFTIGRRLGKGRRRHLPSFTRHIKAPLPSSYSCTLTRLIYRRCHTKSNYRSPSNSYSNSQAAQKHCRLSSRTTTRTRLPALTKSICNSAVGLGRRTKTVSSTSIPFLCLTRTTKTKTRSLRVHVDAAMAVWPSRIAVPVEAVHREVALRTVISSRLVRVRRKKKIAIGSGGVGRAKACKSPRVVQPDSQCLCTPTTMKRKSKTTVKNPVPLIFSAPIYCLAVASARDGHCVLQSLKRSLELACDSLSVRHAPQTTCKRPT